MPLAATKSPPVVILVKLLRTASHQRSLRDGDREHRGTRSWQGEKGDGGLVAGLSWRTSGGLLERRGGGGLSGGEASGDGVDCGGIRRGRRGGGGCGRGGRER